MWDPSLIDGPIAVPVFGPEQESPEGPYRPITGYAPGYHLNVAPSAIWVLPNIEPYVVTPEEPARVFAGAATAFLRFEDEAEARAVLGQYWIEPEEETV